MIDKEKQDNFNKQKWLASERAGKDLSGAMPICPYCEYSTSKATCQIKQDRRDRECACAKALKASKRKRANDRV